MTAVFLARCIQRYNQYIRHSSSTFFSTNSPSRAIRDNPTSVQAAGTDSHRYLCWLLHTYCSPTLVHLGTRSTLSSCHQLNLSITAGFVFRVLVQLSLSYPSCSWVPLHRGALSLAPMLDSYAERYNDMIFKFTLLLLLSLPL